MATIAYQPRCKYITAGAANSSVDISALSLTSICVSNRSTSDAAWITFNGSAAVNSATDDNFYIGPSSAITFNKITPVTEINAIRAGAVSVSLMISGTSGEQI